MAEKLNSKEIVTLRDATLSEVIQFESLVNLLHCKGTIDKEELLEEIKEVRAFMLKDKNGSSMIFLRRQLCGS